MRLFAQLSWYFRREWRRYLGAIALLAIIAVLQLVPPKVVGIVVDGVTQQHYTAEKVWMWIGALVLIAVMVYLLRYVWRVLLFGASYQLAVELREDFYRQLSRQHPAFYMRHRTGDLIARATNDVDRVVFAAGEGVLTLVDSLVMGCAVLIVMSTQISWQLTLLALLPMPLMALAIKRNGDALHERFRVAQAAFSSLNDRTQESLTSIRMIKAFGLEDRQSAQFAADAADTGAKNMRVARIDARFDPTIYIAIGAANLLAIGGGSWMVIHGSLTLGQLTSFVMYLGLMIWPMLALAWMFNIVERGSAAYGRIRTLLEEAPAVTTGPRRCRQAAASCRSLSAISSIRRRANLHWNRLILPFSRGKCWESAGRRAPAKAPFWPCCSAILTSPAARSAFTICRYRVCSSTAGANGWRWSIRRRFYSPIPSPIISRWENRTRRRNRLSGWRGWPACMTTFCVCPRGTIPKWASAA